MRILICEPNVPGRYLHYASLAARAAREVSSDVVLCLSREAKGTPWYDRFVRPLERQVTIRADFEGPRRRSEARMAARVCNGIAHWTFLERYILNLRGDYAIVPSGDAVMNMLAMMPRAFTKGAEIEAVLHTSVLRSEGMRNSLTGQLRRVLIPRAPAVTRLHFTDWTQYADARQRYPTLARKFRMLPHPVETFDAIVREDARRALALPVQGRIAVVAAPEAFRELQPLFELFASRKATQDCRLLVIGRAHPGLESYMQDQLQDPMREGRVVLLIQGYDDADVHRAVSAADLVVGPMVPSAGISPLVLRAAIAGRRFLAAASPWVEMMASLGLGDAFAPGSSDELATRFRRALERGRDPIDPEVVRRLQRFHSPEHFMEAISDRIRTRAGRQPSAGLTWDWVREAAERPTRSSSVA